MKGHCTCQATGLSSHAIARRVERCMSGGNDYPHDPADLKRCDEYLADMAVGLERFKALMSPVSPQWAALVSEWESLVEQMWEEYPTGRAPETYARMRALIDSTTARPRRL